MISTWNKREDLRENLDALRAQTRPFAEIVVVDNASEDGTAAMVAERYPEVRLLVMPHSRYGACETFNIGFKAARTPLVAILDDDVVLPPEWLEQHRRAPPGRAADDRDRLDRGRRARHARGLPALARGRPRALHEHLPRLRQPGARGGAARRPGGYDERLFIYGNERDLTCRLLNLGYRVLQYPAVRAFHKTPFGIKLGSAACTTTRATPGSRCSSTRRSATSCACRGWSLTRVLLRGAATEARATSPTRPARSASARSLRETPGRLVGR